jgi:phosphohistidine phosphatase
VKRKDQGLLVFFLRHAEALDAESFPGADMKRPLTAGGRKAARKIGRWLRAHAAPDVILSSAALRAIQTAEAAAEAMKGPRPKIEPALNPGCTPEAFGRILGGLRAARARTSVVVGHEPDFSQIVSELTADGRLRIKIRKGALAEVEVPYRRGAILKALVDPDTL